MKTTEIGIETGAGSGVSDLTDACAAFARDASDGGSGLLHVFVPHATAGLVVIEMGSGSESDLLEAVERLLPHDDRWTHRHGSPGHGADHVLPLLAPPALSFPVIDGRLVLGTWQSIALLDTNRDNPRRRVRLSFLPA
jgi:secondary thiamine-phosphate synthase enzyme